MGSPVLGDHNTGIQICSSIVPVLWFKQIYILLVYSIVVSIAIGIVEMLLLVLSIPSSTRIFMCVG
jgi:hypothetical protein